MDNETPLPADIDWDTVNVGEPEDDQPTSGPDEPVWSQPQFSLAHLMGLISLCAILCFLATIPSSTFSIGPIVALSFLFLIAWCVSRILQLIRSGETHEDDQ